MITLRPIAIVDTETTSLLSPWLPNGRRMWEIAVITRDIGEMCWRLRLSAGEVASADPEALRIGGYAKRGDRADVTIGGIFGREWLADRIARILAGRTLVGVNPDFDAQTLAWFLGRYVSETPTWHYHTIDVTILGAHTTGLPLDSRSEDVSRALGVDRADFAPAHSALADARWALAQYEAIERLRGAS